MCDRQAWVTFLLSHHLIGRGAQFQSLFALGMELRTGKHIQVLLSAMHWVQYSYSAVPTTDHNLEDYSRFYSLPAAFLRCLYSLLSEDVGSNCLLQQATGCVGDLHDLDSLISLTVLVAGEKDTVCKARIHAVYWIVQFLDVISKAELKSCVTTFCSQQFLALYS